MISLNALTKKFNGFTAVDAVSFEARDGEIFGLLGPNGAGKTTTIRMLATVIEPTSGNASVDGLSIIDHPQQVRERIGVVTAEIGLYDRFTARENLRYFGRLYGMGKDPLERRIEALIDILDMRRFADRRAGTFSTGMKQKVAIARAIIHDPRVIIFDEPTAGLDVVASQTVIRVMTHARKEKKLVVLSTHDMAHAEALCDRVAIMHRSKCVFIGTVKELFEKTEASRLEQAFLALIGEEEARAMVTSQEERSLLKKK